MINKKYLIDVNLPYLFSIWNKNEYVHQKDIDDEWGDDLIWNYTKKNNLTIISKDADFSNRILMEDPPLRIIHIRLGNMRIKELLQILNTNWDEVIKLSEGNKLVNVFRDRLEGIN